MKEHENNNVILVKSKAFALFIIRMYKYLTDEKKEFVLSKQVLRSGTSIGANVKETVYAQSKADFYAKLYIATKEAGETEYWLELLHESGYLDDNVFDKLNVQCTELIKLLVSITKTQKEQK